MKNVVNIIDLTENVKVESFENADLSLFKELDTLTILVGEMPDYSLYNRVMRSRLEAEYNNKLEKYSTKQMHIIRVKKYLKFITGDVLVDVYVRFDN